jgi:hypothetical protein
MNKSSRSPRTFVFAITTLLAFSSSSPAQVRVLISGGFSAPYQELLPQFEKNTGITVTTSQGASEGGGPNGPITISAELHRAVSPPTWSSCRGKGSPSYRPKAESLEVQRSISPVSHHNNSLRCMC